MAVHSLHPTIQSILETRVEAGTDADAFVNPDYDTRPDPMLLTDMDRAVVRIIAAMHGGEKIAGWTDYDCDGIPAGALLADFFAMANYPSYRPYIPERSEGYALNKPGIAALKEEGVSLIITADCGITSVDEVVYAKELGIDVIVTDHHVPGSTLPPAIAVVNPHRTDDTYPCPHLCGTGVAFKLVEAVAARLREEGSSSPFFVGEGQEKWLLDLVALATVADMVPLLHENRTLVRFGLLVLRKSRRKGLRALLEKMRINPSRISEDDIAFSIAPKINAASRMKSPMLGFELLTTSSTARARELAKELAALNDARKLEGARVAKEVKRRLDGRSPGSVIVMGHSTWKPALLGIAATGIVETHRRTVCLWGKDGDIIKGSCRSDGSINIVSLMASVEELFEDYGGHELSGGFSLKADAIHRLPEALEGAYASLKTGADDLRENKRCIPDGTLTLSEVTASFYQSLRCLAPFGVGNPKPVFLFSNLRIERIVFFGKHKDHLRLTVSDGADTVRDAVAFFFERAPYKNELELAAPGDTVSLEASVEESSFGGKTELRLRIENIKYGRL